jgi:hypothetical protein
MSGKSKSPIHIDSPKSSTSSRTKYYTGKMFENLMLKKPEKGGIPEVDRVFSMPELPRLIYEQYKNYLKSEQYKISLNFFVDGISLENLNIVSLALNPRLSPSLIKVLIKMIGDDKAKLKEFYHNLAKNENPKVFSILRKEYKDFPDSDKLDWDALSANPNAISILVKEYNRNTLSNRIGLCFLSKNTHIYAIRILKKIIESENRILTNRICFHFLSKNPTAITLLRNEKNRNHLLNNKEFNLSENPNISELKDILVEEANFNKLDMEKLAGNPFVPRELLNKLMEKMKQNSYIKKKLSYNFSMNPNTDVVKLLSKEYELINLFTLSKNINPEAIKLLRKIINDGIIHPDRHNLSYNLAENPTSEAITLLKELIDIDYTIINWDVLSGNPHPEAIKLLREKIEKERTETHFVNTPIIGQGRINWEKISANTGAFELIIEKLNKEQPDASGSISPYDIIYRINIDDLSKNPAIFVNYKILATAATATTAATAATATTATAVKRRLRDLKPLPLPPKITTATR